MPRETVESSDVLHGDETPFGLQVGWNRDAGFVQVASVTHRQRSMWWQVLAPANNSDTENQKLAIVGECVHRALREAPHDDSTPGPTDAEIGRTLLNIFDTTYGPMDGLYVSMDRPRINRLIKLLRKARDAAYGRDE